MLDKVRMMNRIRKTSIQRKIELKVIRTLRAANKGVKSISMLYSDEAIMREYVKEISSAKKVMLNG